MDQCDFNSSLVRLSAKADEKKGEDGKPFQFLFGAIKWIGNFGKEIINITFQFLFGAIKWQLKAIKMQLNAEFQFLFGAIKCTLSLRL